MENNTNHTIAKLFNELSSGRSIDLDYKNRSYTFTRQNDYVYDIGWEFQE